MIHLKILSIAATDYKALVWDIFFASKNRGLTLQQHFPWLNTPNKSTWYVVAATEDGIIGGLAVREDENASERIASIGLVCVSPAHQQKGISSLLLGLAVEEAKSRGIAALRLWTTKPNVYIRHGFVLADTALFGWINKKNKITVDNRSTHPDEWELSKTDENNHLGLPPFALHRNHWISKNATLTTLVDASGVIVTEWAGQAKNVALLLENVVPERARLNAIAEDILPNELKLMGWSCELKTQHLQMICPLKIGNSPQEWAERHPVRILNRI